MPTNMRAAETQVAAIDVFICQPSRAFLLKYYPTNDLGPVAIFSLYDRLQKPSVTAGKAGKQSTTFSPDGGLERVQSSIVHAANSAVRRAVNEFPVA